MALGVSWWDRVSNVEVFQNVPRVSETVRTRRLRLSGHVQRHEELTAHQLLFWEPDRGSRGRGRPKKTFINQLREDTGLSVDGEIMRLMEDRELWRTTLNTRTLKPP